MGLYITVGCGRGDSEAIDYEKKVIKTLNLALKSNRIPCNLKPSNDEYFGASLGPYSELHKLRRLAAWLSVEGEFPPIEWDGNQYEKILKKYGKDNSRSLNKGIKLQYEFDHLLLHSDCVGFYVPVPFKDVQIFHNLNDYGNFVGSTYELRKETFLISSVLKVQVEKTPDTEIANQLLEASMNLPDPQPNDPPWMYYPEAAYVNHMLYMASKASIQHQALLEFT